MKRLHLPLHKWLLVTHIMAASKKRMSAAQTGRMIGVTYKTAWSLCHRIREAMENVAPTSPANAGLADFRSSCWAWEGDMSYNLFIAYDLMAPGQNYDAVRDAIKSLGTTWQAQFSLFYVHTEHTPDDAFAIVRRALDTNDRLAVINCADMLGAIITNWDHPPIDEINTIWSAP